MKATKVYSMREEVPDGPMSTRKGTFLTMFAMNANKIELPFDSTTFRFNT